MEFTCDKESARAFTHSNQLWQTICGQDETLVGMTSMQMSFLEMFSYSWHRNDSIVRNNCCIICLVGWSRTILHTNTLDVEIVGWCGYTSSAVVRPVRYTAIILGNDIGDALETFWLLYSYFILLIYFIKWWQNVPSSLVKCNSPIFFLL